MIVYDSPFINHHSRCLVCMSEWSTAQPCGFKHKGGYLCIGVAQWMIMVDKRSARLAATFPFFTATARLEAARGCSQPSRTGDRVGSPTRDWKTRTRAPCLPYGYWMASPLGLSSTSLATQSKPRRDQPHIR